MLKKQGVSPDSPECFMIAKQWWEMILEFTGGNLELLPELQKFNDKKTIGIMIWQLNKKK